MRKFLRLTLVCLMAMVCSSALADTYSFTFDKNNKFSGPGTLLLNNVAWTLKTDAGHFMFEGGDNSRGLQIGSKSTPASYIELSTSSFLGTITSVKVNTSGAKNINATIDVTVGGAAFGEQQNLTQSTATDFEFKGSASGELKLNYKNQSKIAIYIKSIEVTYEGSIVSKKAPELAFSETYFNVEQGAEFTSPTFTKATTAPVTFSSDNEFVASVNTEGKISLGGEVGTAKITAKSEENDEYLAGEATCTVTVFTYNTYKKATAVTSGKEYLLVVQKEDFLRPDLKSTLTASDKATLYQAYDALKPFDGRKVPVGPFDQALYPEKLAHLAPVRSFGYCVPTQMYRVPKMHNKFLAFLQQDASDTYQPTSVWTGSLNFTAMSLNSLENAVVIHDPKIAEAFICEAQIIYLKGDPLDWESDWINPWTARDAVTTELI